MIYKRKKKTGERVCEEKREEFSRPLKKAGVGPAGVLLIRRRVIGCSLSAPYLFICL